MLDDDAYKRVYGELGDLLSPDELETVRQISGSREGNHIVYQMPAGKRYGNAVGSLPPGFDVRGVGGYFLLDPSLHKSGNRYEWPEGYAPTEIALQVVPAALQAILDTAHAAHATVKAVTFTTPPTPTTDAPELSRWILPPDVSELIHNPPPKGERSQADYKVVRELCKAGANDDDLLAVFEHFPIGTAGKFAERGRGYLALTIGKARAYVSDNPRTDHTTVPQTIQAARTWRQTADFAAVVPQEVQGTRGYRTLATDKRLFDGFLDVFERLGTLIAPISMIQLSVASGLGNGSVHRSLCRLLAAGIIRKVDAPQGNEGLAHWYELVVTTAFDTCSSGMVLVPKDCGTTIPLEQVSKFTKHKADDAFQRGGNKAQRAKATIKAIGADGLLLVDVLADYGALTQRQIGALTKQGESTISRMVARLADYAVVSVEKRGRERIVTLAVDWQDTVRRLTPDMPTYGNRFRRELSAHLGIIHNCDRQLARNVGDKEKIEHRRKLAARLALDMQSQELAQEFSTTRQKEIVKVLHRHDTHSRIIATLPKNVRTLPIISTRAQKTIAPWFKQTDGLGDKRVDEIMCDFADNEALADAREQMRTIGVNPTPTTEPAAQVPFLAIASVHAVRMAQLGF
jgi:predicted transcriptional regulator